MTMVDDRYVLSVQAMSLHFAVAGAGKVVAFCRCADIVTFCCFAVLPVPAPLHFAGAVTSAGADAEPGAGAGEW